MPSLPFLQTPSLGDVAHPCPAVSDAARRLPRAAIDRIVEERVARLAALHAPVRRPIPVGLRPSPAPGRARGGPRVPRWGSEARRARLERIAAVLPQASVPPRMALQELAALFAGARAVIGVDTGLAHLAAVVGVPTGGIYCGWVRAV